MTEQNTPELRFPEFKEEWLGYCLGDNATIKGRLGWKGLKQSEYVENGYAYLIANKHINNGYINWKSADQINQFRYEESPEIALEKDDIIFSKDGALGNPALVKELPKPSTINSTMMLVRLNSKTISPDFFYQILLGPSFNKLIYLKVSGSSIPHLFQSDMKEFRFHAPTINEQKKIGNFFSKLDHQIELEEEKLELLEQQKKGYMQKIFSQELRFKDENNNNYPEWYLKKLNELGNTFTGLSGKTKDDFGYGDGVFITYMNVFKNTIAKSDMIENVNIEPTENQNRVQYGDILFTTSSEVPNEVGMSSIWLFNQDNVHLNSFCFGFRVVVNYINPLYLARYLRSEEMRRIITILAQGSTRFNISKKEMMNLNIKVPHMDEQNKIVNFFNKIDKLILKQSEKINLLKQRKQGLLQKMFV